MLHVRRANGDGAGGAEDLKELIDAREFGELRSDVRGIADQVQDLRRVNSEEHQANAARLEGMARDLRRALDTKASEEWVREHEGRIKGIEDHFAEGKGMVRTVGIAKGVLLVVTPFAVVLLTKALG